MPGQHGLFITLEGGEGAGKSTQVKKLAETLRARGHDIVLTREPGGTPEAEALRDVFVSHHGPDWSPEAQALLMFTARTLHVDKVIRPALAAGKIVICDRFTDSTRAYQGIVQKAGLEKINQIKQAAIGDLEPDITFIFDIDPEVGLARTGNRQGGGETFDKADISFHQQLRGAYAEIAAENPGRCVMIDASGTMDAVFDQIMNKVDESL